MKWLDFKCPVISSITDYIQQDFDECVIEMSITLPEFTDHHLLQVYYEQFDERPTPISFQSDTFCSGSIAFKGSHEVMLQRR